MTPDAALQALFDDSPSMAFVKDLGGRYIAANRNFADAVGMAPEGIAGCRDTDLFEPDVAAALAAQDRAVAKANAPLEFELPVRHRGSSRVWAMSRFPVRDADGTQRGSGGIATDITERKQAESAQQLLAAIVETSEDAIISRAADCRILTWNRGAERLFGWTAREAIGRHISLIFPPDRRDELARNVDRIESNLPVPAYETVRVTRDGRRIDVSLSHSPVRDGRGNLMSVSLIFRDIGPQKALARELQHTVRFTRLLESLSRAVSEAATPADAMQTCLDRICEYGSWRLGHVVTLGNDGVHHLPITSRWHIRDADRGRLAEFMRISTKGNFSLGKGQFLGAILRTKKPIWIEDLLAFEMRSRITLLKRQGMRCAFAFPVVVENEVAAVLEFFSDEPRPADALLVEYCGNVGSQLARAVERHRAAASLRESEQHMRATFDNAAVGIAHTAMDHRYLRVNDKFCELLGYSREELLRMTTRDVNHPDELVTHGRESEKLLASGIQRSYASEKRFVRKDGSVIWARRTVSLARDETGAPLYYIRVIEDITQRKAEDERFRATFEQSAIGIAHVALDGRMLRVNRRLCDMLGYTTGELLVRTFAELTPPADRQPVPMRNQLLASRDALATPSREKRYVRKDGSTLWCNVSVVLVRNAVGAPDYFVTMVLDISDRKAAEHRLRATFEQAAVGIVHTMNQRYLAVNQKFCDMVGYTREELMNTPPHLISHPDDRGADRGRLEQLIVGRIQTFSAERRYVRRDGSLIWVNRTMSLARDDDGTPLYFIRVVQDITQRKLAEQALRDSDEKFRQLVNNIPQVFWMTDSAQQTLIYVSPAYEKITGRRAADPDLTPRDWLDAVHEDDRDRVRLARRELARTGDYDIEYRVVRPDRSVRWIHDRAFPVTDGKGNVHRIAGIGEDVTERREVQQQLMQLAHYDSLTTLPNRVLFHDRLGQTLAQAQRSGWTVGVLFIDLDRFKTINDTLGHGAGDLLLRQVSARLIACVRTVDTVGRLSGDEFAVILSELTETQDAGLVAQKIINALAAPFDLDGNEVFVTASVGITLYPADSDNLETLIRNADAAMYSAKNLGRNNYQYYTTAMNERAHEKMDLERRLRRALKREEFLLYYQPKVDIATGEIAGFEALLRWQPPETGLTLPDRFIPLLEETGLIVPVGAWVLRAACAQIHAWQQRGISPVPIAVNLSARQFLQKDLAVTITETLAGHGIDPRWLELEITESALMQNPEDAVVALKHVKSLGIRVSVDDFGTGYSSLNYLKRFPLDVLKVDRTFVRDIAVDADDAAIVRAVVTMAHSLGLRVIAEGVETVQQLSFLASHGCDEAQGFLFSQPLAATDCTAMLARRERLVPARRDALSG